MDADGINNAGQIVGHGMLNGGHHAFLLEPVPDSSRGLTLSLEPTASQNLWRLTLGRRPATNVSFEVSEDLVNWIPTSFTNDGDAYLVEGGRAIGPRFFRAAFKP